MRRHIFGFLGGFSMLVAIACGDPAQSIPAPSAPTPLPAPAPGSQAVVSGTVWIHDAGGVRPDANGRMFGWVQQPTQGSTTGPVSLDANGRFRITVPLGAQVRLQSATPNAYQPCQVVLRANADVTADVHAVVDRQQLGSRIPWELRAQAPLLSGVVFEEADGRRTPLSDVRVELDGLAGLGFVAATTLTDADGRYILCGLADEARTYVYASRSGYRLFESTVGMAGDTNLDIEMRR